MTGRSSRSGLLHRIRRLQREDVGVSLVELLVLMLILGVVGGIVVAGVANGGRAQARLENRVTALTDVQKAVERVSRLVRASDARTTGNPYRALREAGAGRVVTEVYQGADRIQSTFFTETVNGRVRLCEHRSVQLSSATPPTPPTSPTCHLVHVSDILTTSPVFSFRDEAGAVVTGSDPSLVKRVEIRIRRNIPMARPIEVATTVQLRNGQ